MKINEYRWYWVLVSRQKIVVHEKWAKVYSINYMCSESPTHSTFKKKNKKKNEIRTNILFIKRPYTRVTRHAPPVLHAPFFLFFVIYVYIYTSLWIECECRLSSCSKHFFPWNAQIESNANKLFLFGTRSIFFFFGLFPSTTRHSNYYFFLQ